MYYAEFKILKFYTNYSLSFLMDFFIKLKEKEINVNIDNKKLNLFLNEKNINYNSNLFIYFKENILDINNLNIFEFFLHMKKVSYKLYKAYKLLKKNDYILDIKKRYQQQKQFKVDFSKFSKENKLY
jgi:hypothetical protein